ncbi:MAG: DegT/DnrJ/EryC1/StrS family aminotransferase [Ferrovibrio sp.]|uniref:DegT/DnrJ/EryC1/StrS family aminotransferase n=1 Tax=Ferrovibrio sp. TaxID=1917215 RepID=UPI002637A1F1|nr:DegT/DnrJ/EryC1/StrS family aminotransferase [Ferrovibrio sp.]MCW0234936.1 DegT/DnrJ/EryC1/StrS family aminotransferase [Ferrovibrio sp.]
MTIENPIPFGRPQMGQAEIDAVVQVLSGPQLVHGPVAKAFEQRFAARAGAKHAITVSSCTTGLHLVLHVHDIGPGDEVIVPAMTHVATANAVEYCRAKPVFADILPDSGNIDPAHVQSLLTPATRAIIPVHYLGLPCDMDRLEALARPANAFLLEDCALALDADYDGRKAGTLGLAGTFSFYPAKHMTTAEGGMIITDDDNLAQRLGRAKAFSYDRGLGERTKPGIYDVVGLGFNYRMSEVHAAIGLAQMDRLDEIQKVRARNYAALRDSLAGLDEVTVFAPQQGKARSSHYCLNAILPHDRSIDRDAVVQSLNAQGIGTSVHYPSAVPLFTFYREKYGYRPGQFPVAEWMAEQTISLPVGPHLHDGDPERIGAAMKTAIMQAKRQ